MTETGCTFRIAGAFSIAVVAVLLNACGDGKATGSGAAQAGPGAGQPQSATAGDSAQGPDLSELPDIVLASINRDPTRMELKVTARLVEFNVKSAETQVLEGMGASSVVECAGAVVFDGDVEWNWQDTEPKKSGEPAKFECHAEYQNQGKGWTLFGPLGIYPL